MALALITLSPSGYRIARELARTLPEAELFVHRSCCEGQAAAFDSVVALTGEIFGRMRALVYIAPCGVAVRAIAPNLRHKTTDPGVVAIDVAGRYVVSLAGGHEGGANQLAYRLASLLGAEPVVSTSTEAARSVIVGVGCRRGTPAEAILSAVREALRLAGSSLDEVRVLASATLKADEPGLLEAAERLGVPLRLLTPGEIRSTAKAFAPSQLVERKVGLPAVAEPAALLAGRRTRLLLPRKVFDGVTVAVAREDSWWSESDREADWTEPAAPSRPSPSAGSSSATSATSN
ncbi:MAG: cobalamin biosynthesis protein [Armatimonadetes bacterium]|nr:cobalamin biosynthesis protein [Armatimonadota bacterium]